MFKLAIKLTNFFVYFFFQNMLFFSFCLLKLTALKKKRRNTNPLSNNSKAFIKFFLLYLIPSSPLKHLATLNPAIRSNNCHLNATRAFHTIKSVQHMYLFIYICIYYSADVWSSSRLVVLLMKEMLPVRLAHTDFLW